LFSPIYDLFECIYSDSSKTHLIKPNKKGLKRAAKYGMRPLCKACKQRPCAVNYHKANKVFYRSQCELCVRYKGKSMGQTKWQQSGYVKKNECDKCSHKSRHAQQFNVFHVDGNLNNCRFSNLKTVCANCQRVLQAQGIKWVQGDLVPDF
jgi:hypothetical protein